VVKIKDVPAPDEDMDGTVEDEPVKKAKKGKKAKKVVEKKGKKGKKASAKPEKGSKKGGAFSKLPFKQETSIIARAFQLAQKGSTIKDLTSFVKKEGGEPTRVLRILKGGSAYGKTWKVHENKGQLKIVY
jgi:hypothetical protein